MVEDAIWKLPNGGELTLGTLGTVLTLGFETPRLVVIGKGEEEYFRTYGNN